MNKFGSSQSGDSSDQDEQEAPTTPDFEFSPPPDPPSIDEVDANSGMSEIKPDRRHMGDEAYAPPDEEDEEKPDESDESEPPDKPEPEPDEDPPIDLIGIPGETEIQEKPGL